MENKKRWISCKDLPNARGPYRLRDGTTLSVRRGDPLSDATIRRMSYDDLRYHFSSTLADNILERHRLWSKYPRRRIVFATVCIKKMSSCNANISIMPRSPAMIKPQHWAMYRLYADGAVYRDIAYQFSLSIERIRQIVMKVHRTLDHRPMTPQLFFYYDLMTQRMKSKHHHLDCQ